MAKMARQTNQALVAWRTSSEVVKLLLAVICESVDLRLCGHGPMPLSPTIRAHCRAPFCSSAKRRTSVVVRKVRPENGVSAGPIVSAATPSAPTHRPIRAAGNPHQKSGGCWGSSGGSCAAFRDRQVLQVTGERACSKLRNQASRSTKPACRRVPVLPIVGWDRLRFARIQKSWLASGPASMVWKKGSASCAPGPRGRGTASRSASIRQPTWLDQRFSS